MSDKSKRVILMITENAMVATLYYVLTVFNPLSYPMIQFRISEVLVLLAFWRPDFLTGLTIGCLLANLFNPMQTMMLADVFMGTGATIIAVLLVSFASPRLWVACIWPPLINGAIVGLELYFFVTKEIPLWVQMGWVCLGELAVMVVGYSIFWGLCRSKAVMEYMQPIRHAEVRW